tara:strand:+ start:1756 stop:2898 length:1143 start_codon:yes stop_codon:yes gene_type:complete
MAIDLGYQFEKYSDNAKNFLESGSMVARIVFFILVIIGFVLLLRLGIAILAWIFNPKANVVVSSGMTNGSTQAVYPSNPQVKGSVPIMRSDNQLRGIEFTWSAWLFIDGNQISYNKDRFKHVFSKGNTNIPTGVNSNTNSKTKEKDDIFIPTDGIIEPLNGPGLYISPINSPNVAELSLLVRMNIFTNESPDKPLTQLNNECIKTVQAFREDYENGKIDLKNEQTRETLNKCRKEFSYLNTSGNFGNLDEGFGGQPMAPLIYDDVVIPDIPINKWISVIIRLENNNILDIYINGRLMRRHTLRGIAKQNYGPTNVSLNGGFAGFLSELQYFNYAIGTAEIDWIVENGPNLKGDGHDMNAKPYYLANSWFDDNLDPVYSYN